MILLNQDSDFSYGNSTYWNPHIYGMSNGSIIWDEEPETFFSTDAGGSGSIALPVLHRDSVLTYYGSYSLKIDGGLGSYQWFKIFHDYTTAKNLSQFDKTYLALYWENASSPLLTLNFLTNDSNYYYQNIFLNFSGWQYLTVDVGDWSIIGSPDWNSISSIEFYSEEVNTTLYIDRFFMESSSGGYSFSFDGNYGYLSLDSIAGSFGHLALGSWWNQWAFTGNQKFSLDDYSVFLDVDLAITSAIVPSGSWLRVGLANAFFNNTFNDYYNVFYTELDVYDSPHVYSHSGSDLASGGNIVYSDNQTVELQVFNMSIGIYPMEPFHFDISSYLKNAHWGKEIGSMFESSYVVIEWEDEASIDVVVDNFQLRISPKTFSGNIDSFQKRTETFFAMTSGVEIKHNTLGLRGANGYSVYATIQSLGYSSRSSGISDDNMLSFWVNSSATSGDSVTLIEDTRNKKFGASSLKAKIDKATLGYTTYIRHSYWMIEFNLSKFDFFTFYYYARNERIEHRLLLVDAWGKYKEWVFSDEIGVGWKKLTFPIDSCPNSTGLNPEELADIWIFLAYNQSSLVDRDFNFDHFMLENGVNVDFELEVPDTTTDIQMYSHNETGYELFADTTTLTFDPNAIVWYSPRFWGYDFRWLYGAFNGTILSDYSGFTLFKLGLKDESKRTIWLGDNRTDLYDYSEREGSTYRVAFRLRFPPYDGFPIEKQFQSYEIRGGLSAIHLRIDVLTNSSSLSITTTKRDFSYLTNTPYIYYPEPSYSLAYSLGLTDWNMLSYTEGESAQLTRATYPLINFPDGSLQLYTTTGYFPVGTWELSFSGTIGNSGYAVFQILESTLPMKVTNSDRAGFNDGTGKLDIDYTFVSSTITLHLVMSKVAWWETHIMTMLGFVGVGMMMFSPMIMAYKAKKKSYMWLLYGTIAFIIGFALFIGWLYS